MNKKSVIWVEAVLYLALGVIAITLVLSAGVPVVNRMKDRNTIIQTKTLMYSIDNNIRQVASEGPGSKRQLNPIDITAGELYIYERDDMVRWQLKTSLMLMEPNINRTEGTLLMYLNESKIEGEYTVVLELDYKDIVDIILDSDYGNPLSGRYTMYIQHNGTYTNQSIPVVKLRLV